MQYMNPHFAVHTVYLDDKLVPRHRSNRRPLPRYAAGGDILFFCGKYVISWQMYKDFFLYIKDQPELLNPNFVPAYTDPATEPSTRILPEDQDDGDLELPDLPNEYDRPSSYADMCIVGFPVELRIKEMTIQEVESRALERSSLTKCRDKCLKKMYETFTTERGFPQFIAVRELASRFKLPTHVIRRVLRMADLNAPRVKVYRDMFPGDPRVDMLMTMVRRTQTMARNKGEYGGFTLKDALPYHPGTSDQYIPGKCPVLGYELEYRSVGDKSVNAMRIGRKHTSRPFESGNVLIMSYLACRLIEGSLSKDRASLAVDSDMAKHWRTWSRDHVTNWGKTKLGRPSKKKDKAEEKT